MISLIELRIQKFSEYDANVFIIRSNKFVKSMLFYGDVFFYKPVLRRPCLRIRDSSERAKKKGEEREGQRAHLRKFKRRGERDRE